MLNSSSPPVAPLLDKNMTRSFKNCDSSGDRQAMSLAFTTIFPFEFAASTRHSSKLKTLGLLSLDPSMDTAKTLPTQLDVLLEFIEKQGED